VRIVVSGIIGLLIGIVIGFLVYAYTPIGQRYEITNANAEVIVYKYDKWTGQVLMWVGGGDRWLRIPEKVVTYEQYKRSLR